VKFKTFVKNRFYGSKPLQYGVTSQLSGLRLIFDNRKAFDKFYSIGSKFQEIVTKSFLRLIFDNRKAFDKFYSIGSKFQEIVTKSFLRLKTFTK
jgi:hypothetical protein